MYDRNSPSRVVDTRLPIGTLIRRWSIVVVAVVGFGVGLSAVAGSFESGLNYSPPTAVPGFSDGRPTTLTEAPTVTGPSASQALIDTDGATTSGRPDEPQPARAVDEAIPPAAIVDAPSMEHEQLVVEVAQPVDEGPSDPNMSPITSSNPPPPSTIAPSTTTTTTTVPPDPTTTTSTTTTSIAPGTTTTTLPTPSDGGIDTAFGSKLVALANKAREAEGIAPLAISGSLTSHAESWAQHLAASQSLGHSDIGSLLGGWSTVGENVAAGQPTAPAMHAAWMGSSAHRANLLNPAFTHVGIAVVIDSGGVPRGVQVFGG